MQIPIGTQLTLNVEHIDKQEQKVRVSNWQKVEDVVSGLLRDDNGKKNLVKAHVVETRDDGRIVVALELGETTPDVNVVTTAYDKKLSKSASEFKVGEQVAIKAVFRKKPSYAPLPKLPNKAAHLEGESSEKGLSWRRGELHFIGRMTYDQLYYFKTIAERDVAFHKALEDLYWYSNHIYVVEFLDSKLLEHLEQNLAEGSVVEDAKVLYTNKGGVILDLGNDVRGFAPWSKVLGGARSAFDSVVMGSMVQAKVIEARIDRGEPLLEITGVVSES